MRISRNMFLSVCVIAGVVCDIGGKKQGDACRQEKTPETRIFRDRAHSSSQEGRRRGHAVKIVQNERFFIMLYTKKNSGAYHGQGNNYAHKRNMHCIRLNPMRRVVPPKRNTQSATMTGISRWWYWKLWKIFSKQIKNWGYNKTATAPESGHQFYWRGCKRGLPTSVSSDVSMLWSRSTFRIFPNSNFYFICIKHLFLKHACNNCLLIRFHSPYYSCSQLSAFWPLTNLGIFHHIDYLFAMYICTFVWNLLAPKDLL